MFFSFEKWYVCVVSSSFAATRINGNCVADIRSVVVLFTAIVALCCTMLFYLFASRSRPLNLTVSHLGPWLKKFFNSRCQRLTVNQPFPCQFLTMLQYQCKRHKKRFAGATAFLLSSILHLLLFSWRKERGMATIKWKLMFTWRYQWHTKQGPYLRRAHSPWFFFPRCLVEHLVGENPVAAGAYLGRILQV